MANRDGGLAGDPLSKKILTSDVTRSEDFLLKPFIFIQPNRKLEELPHNILQWRHGRNLPIILKIFGTVLHVTLCFITNDFAWKRCIVLDVGIDQNRGSFKDCANHSSTCPTMAAP